MSMPKQSVTQLTDVKPSKQTILVRRKKTPKQEGQTPSTPATPTP